MALGFSPALLSSIGGILPDVATYQANVVSNGGSVSPATLQAINQLAGDLTPYKSSIQAFYPAAGNNVQAAKTALYGSDLAPSGYGAGNYAEGTGLINTASTTIDSGVQAAAINQANFTVGLWFSGLTYSSSYQGFFLIIDTSRNFQLGCSTLNNSAGGIGGRAGLYDSGDVYLSASANSNFTKGLLLLTSSNDSDLRLFQNDSVAAFSTAQRRITNMGGTYCLPFFAQRNIPTGSLGTGMAANLQTAFVLNRGITNSEASDLYAKVRNYINTMGRN